MTTALDCAKTVLRHAATGVGTASCLVLVLAGVVFIGDAVQRATGSVGLGLSVIVLFAGLAAGITLGIGACIEKRKKAARDADPSPF